MYVTTPTPLPTYFTRSQCRLNSTDETCMMAKTDNTSVSSRDYKDSSASTSEKYPMSMYPPGPSIHLNDSSLTPSPFQGTDKENAQDWLSYFRRYAHFKLLDERSTLALFGLLMRGTANTWYTTLSDDDRKDLDTVLGHFETKYAPAPVSLWRRASELFSRDQKPQETVEEFYSDMMRKAREVNAADEMTRYAIMRGLRPQLRTYVMQQNPSSAAELLDAAKVAEATVADINTTANAEILEAISRLEQRVTNSVTSSVTDNRQVRFTTPPSARRDTYTRRNDRRPPAAPLARSPSPGPTRAWGEPPRRPLLGPQLQAPPTGRYTASSQPGCTNCARYHMPGQCVARGKVCRCCGKLNHFAVCCRSRPRE